MLRITVVLTWIFVSSLLALSQGRALQEPRLAYRVTSGERWQFRADENSLFDYNEVLRQPGTLVAVRFCSNEPLPKVLLMSNERPHTVRNFLEQSYSYGPERILFLRDAGCQTGDSPISATEIWVIPQGAPIPSATEMIKSCQFRLDRFRRDSFGNDSDFDNALRELAIELNRPQVVGLIVGVSYAPTDAAHHITRNLCNARRILEQSGIPTERYIIRHVERLNETSSVPTATNYPTITVASIESSCP